MIDAVLTPHPNELTCGTGKWSIRLAEHLGVPCRPVGASVSRALVSARMSELPVTAVPPPQFDLIVHDWETTYEEFIWPSHWGRWIHGADRIYAANAVLQRQIQPYRADVQLLPIPSSLNGNPDRGGFRVLTYGMAHKLTAPHYAQLRGLLEKAHPDYTVSLSTAVHEGTPWDESLQRASGVLSDVFGGKLRILGYLGDDGLASELAQADVVALFYNPALRSNNTTAWAALDAGKPLVTNLDECSPKELTGKVLNIHTLRHWPFAHTLKDYGRLGQKVAQTMGWEQLLGVLRA